MRTTLSKLLVITVSFMLLLGNASSILAQGNNPYKLPADKFDLLTAAYHIAFGERDETQKEYALSFTVAGNVDISTKAGDVEINITEGKGLIKTEGGQPTFSLYMKGDTDDGKVTFEIELRFVNSKVYIHLVQNGKDNGWLEYTMADLFKLAKLPIPADIFDQMGTLGLGSNGSNTLEIFSPALVSKFVKIKATDDGATTRFNVNVPVTKFLFSTDVLCPLLKELEKLGVNPLGDLGDLGGMGGMGGMGGGLGSMCEDPTSAAMVFQMLQQFLPEVTLELEQTVDESTKLMTSAVMVLTYDAEQTMSLGSRSSSSSGSVKITVNMNIDDMNFKPTGTVEVPPNAKKPSR